MKMEIMNKKTPFNRKLRKLRRNPKLFFTDFIKNKQKSCLNFFYAQLPRKKSTSKKYTIVCAVYNVEQYLDDFFRSVIEQRLDFETNIEIILVDDGSPDNSGKVIKKWILKYPKNIFYYKKKNGGQASARNLGLRSVKTEWVTFIDPDDFIDINYFYLVDEYLAKQQNTNAFVTKFKLYKEKYKTYHDGFQTDFCFNKPERELKFDDLEDCVQFSSSSSIYKNEIIKSSNLQFDEKLTASFEDTKFFYEYLSHVNDGNIVYLRDALYNYRLRENESSSSNSQWTKKAKYLEFFEYGLLDVVQTYVDKLGYVPAYIQRLILFSVIPYLQVATINSNRITMVLNDKECTQLFSNIKKSLDYVNVDVISKFYNSPGNYFWISAILYYFKNTFSNDQRVYINKVNTDEERIYFRFYGRENLTKFSLFLEGELCEPTSVKIVKHQIINSTLIDEFNVCYDIPLQSKIEMMVNGHPATIYTDFKVLTPSSSDVYNGYLHKEREFENIAVFIDSGTKADDNAEHLYYQLLIKNPLLNIEHYYLLDKESIHWSRLLDAGFNLVNVNSLKAKKLLKSSKYIFSSYLPGHLNQWVERHNFKFQKYVFLQHGVVTSNLSKPFNAFYSQIYKTVISTSFEREEILNNKFNYLMHKQDLINSGIPRFDKLFQMASKANKKTSKIKKILICPTWRSTLDSLDLSQDKNMEKIISSEYYKKWFGLMNSNEFRKIVDKFDLEVTVCPHVNFYNLVAGYGLEKTFFPESGVPVRFINPNGISYQNLFFESDLLLTDYSSLHFDFASLRKPVLYYQFDKLEFYGKTHAYRPGIFNYTTDGFGPVFEVEEDLLLFISSILSKKVSGLDKYIRRSKSIFLSNHGQNSVKIYNGVFNQN